MNVEEKTLLLIDANSLIHRFYHALPPLTSPKGEPTASLYGISQVMLKILREIKPDYMAAAFDRPEPTFRDEMFKDYKAHRPKAADELISQIIRSHDVFDKFKVKTFELAGYEADDIIGTLVEKFRGESQLKIMIFSGDLDALQLVQDDKVVVQFLLKGISETKTYNEAAVLERYGLKPAQLPEYKGFVGDASDNIPGVKGIGPKTALTLIKDFGTVEEVFNSLSIISEKVVKKLEGHADEAILSKKLAIINRNVPIFLESVHDLQITPFDVVELSVFFRELGFESLVKRIHG